MQSESVNMKFSDVWVKYQGHILTFWPKLADFDHFVNMQSESVNMKFSDVWVKYQGHSLTFWPNLADFDHFSICS